MLSSPYVKEFAYIPGHHHLSTTTYRSYTYKAKSLDHLVDQLGHVLLPVSGITTLDVASELSRPPSTSGVGELEGPKVGGSLLEVGSASSDLVNQVLHTYLLVEVFGRMGKRHTDDTEFTELLLDDLVVGDGDSLSVDLCVSSLVDEFSDSFKVDLTVGNVRTDEVEHLLSSLGDSDEDTVIDLQKSEKL